MIEIKKYSNRRLYNTETSAYITLDDIVTLIKKELDFNDVLILPQPNDMYSRSQVNLERTFHFCNSYSPGVADTKMI